MANYAIVQEKENLVVEVGGSQGPEGIQGPIGPIGNTGPQGIQGEQGLAGEGFFNSALPPATPSEGNVWYDQTQDTLNVLRNTTWEEIPMKEELNGTFGSVTLNAGYF